MAKNLLAWAPHLTHQDCKAIAYAMRNYGPPENNLTRYDNYRIATAERRIIFLLDAKVVIAALLKAEADRPSRLSSFLVPFPVGAFAALASKLTKQAPQGVRLGPYLR